MYNALLIYFFESEINEEIEEEKLQMERMEGSKQAWYWPSPS